MEDRNQRKSEIVEKKNIVETILIQIQLILQNEMNGNSSLLFHLILLNFIACLVRFRKNWWKAHIGIF